MTTVVPAGLAHAEVISALLKLAFPDGWDEKSVREILAMPGAWSWIALKDDTPVGVIVIQAAADQGDIITLASHPEHRRTQVATDLLSAATTKARDLGLKTLFLDVAEDNAPALAFYKIQKFEKSGRRKEYYRKSNAHRVDAIVLKLVL